MNGYLGGKGREGERILWWGRESQWVWVDGREIEEERGRWLGSASSTSSLGWAGLGSACRGQQGCVCVNVRGHVRDREKMRVLWVKTLCEKWNFYVGNENVSGKFFLENFVQERKYLGGNFLPNTSVLYLFIFATQLPNSSYLYLEQWTSNSIWLSVPLTSDNIKTLVWSIEV